MYLRNVGVGMVGVCMLWVYETWVFFFSVYYNGRREGVGVMNDKETKLEEIEVSHTLGGSFSLSSDQV